MTPLDRMADFDLTPEQREVRKTARAFAEREVLHQKLIAEYVLGQRGA